MRRWGGLPTTGPAAPPSSPGRHRAEPARRAEITPPFRPGARAAYGTGHPRASAPGLPRRALAGLPQQAGRRALRAGAGYLARAARGEHIAFAVGARRIALLWRLPDGAAEDDWREATGTDAARAAVADYRPGWCPADTPLLLGRGGAC